MIFQKVSLIFMGNKILFEYEGHQQRLALSGKSVHNRKVKQMARAAHTITSRFKHCSNRDALAVWKVTYFHAMLENLLRNGERKKEEAEYFDEKYLSAG